MGEDTGTRKGNGNGGIILRTLCGAAALVVVLGGLRVAAPMITQFLMVAFIAIIMSPLYYIMRKWRFPHWLSVTLLLLAIAGILAMGPEYLILDEPTAGLDPAGRKDILDTVARLHREEGLAVVLVSHSMDDVAEYVDRVVAMAKGRILLDGPVREVFAEEETLRSVGLSVPQATRLAKELGLPGTVLTLDELEQALTESGLLARFAPEEKTGGEPR